MLFNIFYICSSAHHNSRLKKSNKMQQYADSYPYWTMHHLDSWIKIDQLMSLALFFAQHVSNASTFTFRSLQLCVGILLWFDVCWCYGVVRLGWCGNLMQAAATISRKLLKMDVLTFETRWAVNSGIIKQVTSSWSIFIRKLFYFVV